MQDTVPPSDDHSLHVQQLFVRNQQALLGYVLSMEPNFADAQDIVQEVFLVISRKAHTWSAGTNFLAWACTVARYTSLDFQRKRARRVARLDEDVMELLYGGEIPDETAADHQVKLLQTCLNRLAPKAREIVWLRYHNAEKPEQIADRVGWTSNAINVALTRARTFLRECLEHQLASSNAL
jgi:RNA polymerase sigma-70 factor (ECF subfamily)